MKHVKTCTKPEVRRILDNDWALSLAELNAFIGIIFMPVEHMKKRI